MKKITHEKKKVGDPKKNLMTLNTFLSRNEISRSTYYQLKRADLAPREIRIGRAVYISAREERRWTKKMSDATLMDDDDETFEI
jgi:predicted DNA-binding transcriptional regulator AlpA